MDTTLAKLEDGALIERALAGQPECFAALVDRHAAAVKMRIRSMARNPAEMDDVLQEVLLKGLEESVDIPARSQFSHLDDSRGRE